jgi:hypothetical protein
LGCRRSAAGTAGSRPAATLLGSFDDPSVSAIGVEIDRKVAALLEALGAEVPMALFAS